MKSLLVLFLSMSIAGDQEDTKIPNEFQGAWKIVAVVEDTGDEISADDPEYPGGFPVELLIVGNRLVFVDANHDAKLARLTVLEKRVETDSQSTFELRRGQGSIATILRPQAKRRQIDD